MILSHWPCTGPGTRNITGHCAGVMAQRQVTMVNNNSSALHGREAESRDLFSRQSSNLDGTHEKKNRVLPGKCIGFHAARNSRGKLFRNIFRKT